VSLSYEVPAEALRRLNINSCKFYLTGRNLATFSKFTALDPELTNQYGLPLQKEFVFGLTITL
jgi:hypothetical protein